MSETAPAKRRRKPQKQLTPDELEEMRRKHHEAAERDTFVRESIAAISLTVRAHLFPRVEHRRKEVIICADDIARTVTYSVAGGWDLKDDKVVSVARLCRMPVGLWQSLVEIARTKHARISRSRTRRITTDGR